MKAFYGLPLFCLLFERAFVETRLIQKARTQHWDHRSCLQICGRPGTFPVECMEVCNSKHREDFASKFYTRTRKSVPIGQKKCPEYNRQSEDEKVIPEENISANFTKDTNNNWIAIIQWKPINDLRKWEGYRVTYAELTHPISKSKCVLLIKNETKIIIHDKDRWNYPNGLTLVVSMYHSNSSVHGAYGVSFLPEETTGIPSAPLLPGKGSYWPIILGISVGVTLVGTLLIFIYRRKRRQRRYIHPSPESPTIVVPIKEESYMVSYYPESVKYIERIASIVNWFRETAGYDVIMDKMATNEMSTFGPMDWAERQIRKASKVLVFLSPGYVRLCTDCEETSQQRTLDDIGRVWYEIRLLKTVFRYTHSSAKMVCIQMDETINVHDLPPWAEVRYRWPKDRDEILNRLNNISEIAPARIAENTLNVEEHSHEEL